MDEPIENKEDAQSCNSTGEQTDTAELDKVPMHESSLPFNPRDYQGFKIKIEKVWIDKEATNWYNGPKDSTGRKTYNSNSTEKMQKVIIETYGLPVLDGDSNATDKLVTTKNEDGSIKYYRVSAKFNLQLDNNGVWSISKAPSAKLWAFMRKCGANVLSELKDTVVVLDIQPDRDESSDAVWLRISI